MVNGVTSRYWIDGSLAMTANIYRIIIGVYHLVRNRPSKPTSLTCVALPSRVEGRNTFGSFGIRLAIPSMI